MKTNYSILFIAGAIILLTSCAYDGISGSSGDSTAEIDGLWIQAQGATLTGEDAPSCGCKEEGKPGRAKRRCFNYFENGKVVSGYLKIEVPDRIECAGEISRSLLEERKESLFSLIDSNKGRPASSVDTDFVADLAVGNYKNQGRNKIVTIEENENSGGGVYFNILYPGGLTVGKTDLEIVCTAYAPGDNENELFIATDESGGVVNQKQSNSGCNAERHTTLIKYIKVDRPKPSPE